MADVPIPPLTSTGPSPVGQSVFREVNERVRALTNLFSSEEVQEFICECARAGCIRTVRMTAAEYDRVRGAGPNHYLVGADHLVRDSERCVVVNGRFAVVVSVEAGELVVMGGEGLEPRPPASEA
jgi:hypothetical protein